MPYTSNPYGIYAVRDNIVPPEYLSASHVAAFLAAARAEITARHGHAYDSPKGSK